MELNNKKSRILIVKGGDKLKENKIENKNENNFK